MTIVGIIVTDNIRVVFYIMVMEHCKVIVIVVCMQTSIITLCNFNNNENNLYIANKINEATKVT